MHIARKRLTVISLLLLAALLLPAPTLAQGAAMPNRDWSGLKAVTSGSKLFTKLKDGKTISGKLTGVSDTALSLSVKGNPMDLNRDDILSVSLDGRKSAKKATLIGLGVGAGAGAAIGAAGGESGSDPMFISKSTAAAGFAILGAGAGAITGYLIGRTGRKRVLPSSRKTGNQGSHTINDRNVRHLAVP